MNVYKKLQDVSVKLQETTIKKSGKNKFAGFSYFELGDFLPIVNKLFKDNGLNGFVKFDKELATLLITNTDKIDEQILVTSPMVEISMKGANAIQNLGAVETYQRRYLYLAALGIVENDIVDSRPMDKKPKTKEQANAMTLDSIKEILNNDLTRTKAVLGYYKIKNVDDLDLMQAEDCLVMLRKK